MRLGVTSAPIVVALAWQSFAACAKIALANLGPGEGPVEERGVERKLAAILAADMVGYSRLMERDETGTITRQKVHRQELIDPEIASHNGRIVKTTGDGLLAEFGSVVDAVACAVAIQRAMAEREAEVPEERRIQYRIGINLGDIVIDEGDIYGDGVNIAARLEEIAEPGGLSISGTAYDQLKQKVDAGYEFLGERKVKNIAEPVRVYRVLVEPGAAGTVIGEKRPKPGRWRLPAVAAAVVIAAAVVAVRWQPWAPDVEPASIERMAFALPDKPSIAVLPFDNLSGDPGQGVLVDGITENIITTLAKVPGLFVIARNSTFTYKGKPTKVQQVAEELGVRYVLEGSVQRSGETMRTTAQLVDALSGRHIWAERYDRNVTDIFALQDEIALNILTALQVALTEGERARLSRAQTGNLEAYLQYLQAVAHFRRFTREDNDQARRLAEQAIELDPEFAAVWVILGWTHQIAARFGWSESRAVSYKRVAEIARKARSLDESDPGVYSLLGAVNRSQRKFDEAITMGRKAISLGPSVADYYASLAVNTYYAGNFEETVTLTKKAMRLHPKFPDWYLYRIGVAYRMLGQYEEAVAALKQFYERLPKRNLLSLTALAATYSMMGRNAEARALVTEALELDPKASAERVAKMHYFRDPAHLERILDALRKAGLPQSPPLPLPDKPSIAVLPFDNLSADPDQEYFADGMAEDIITDLSKISGLFVIARNSSFAYKGKQADVRAIARELGVKYILEGSVRRAGDQVRINAQLIDATTGGHVWADRFDGDLSDVFALQDGVIGRIVSALAVKLTDAEKSRQATRRKDINLEAYDNLLRGRQLLSRIAGQDTGKAKEYFEKAISIDPSYGRAYTNLGLLFWSEWRLWGRDRDANLARADEYGRKAIELDPTDAGARVLLAVVYQYQKRHDLAEIEADKAIALNPTHAETLGNLGGYLRFAGRPRESIEYLERAVRLDPYHPTVFLTWLGSSYSWIGQHDQAIKILKNAISREPDYIVNHLVLAAAYGQSGRDADARAEASEVLRLNPKFSLSVFAAFVPIRRKADLDRLVMALRKAGIPE